MPRACLWRSGLKLPLENICDQGMCTGAKLVGLKESQTVLGIFFFGYLEVQSQFNVTYLVLGGSGNGKEGVLTRSIYRAVIMMRDMAHRTWRPS